MEYPYRQKSFESENKPRPSNENLENALLHLRSLQKEISECKSLNEDDKEYLAYESLSFALGILERLPDECWNLEEKTKDIVLKQGDAVGDANNSRYIVHTIRYFQGKPCIFNSQYQALIHLKEIKYVNNVPVGNRKISEHLARCSL